MGESVTTDELVSELRRYEAGITQPAPASAPAPRKTLRQELEELAGGPFDLERERRKIAVAAAIAAGAE